MSRRSSSFSALVAFLDEAQEIVNNLDVDSDGGNSMADRDESGTIAMESRHKSSGVLKTDRPDIADPCMVTTPAASKPRRPLTAYNIFFQVERDRIINGVDDAEPYTAQDLAIIESTIGKRKDSKRIHRKSHGKIEFADLAKIIGQRWRAIDGSVKRLFEKRAKEDVVRYHCDMAAWNASVEHDDAINTDGRQLCTTQVPPTPAQKRRSAAPNSTFESSTPGLGVLYQARDEPFQERCEGPLAPVKSPPLVLEPFEVWPGTTAATTTQTRPLQPRVESPPVAFWGNALESDPFEMPPEVAAAAKPVVPAVAAAPGNSLHHMLQQRRLDAERDQLLRERQLLQAREAAFFRAAARQYRTGLRSTAAASPSPPAHLPCPGDHGRDRQRLAPLTALPESTMPDDPQDRDMLATWAIDYGHAVGVAASSWHTTATPALSPAMLHHHYHHHADWISQVTPLTADTAAFPPRTILVPQHYRDDGSSVISKVTAHSSFTTQEQHSSLSELCSQVSLVGARRRHGRRVFYKVPTPIPSRSGDMREVIDVDIDDEDRQEQDEEPHLQDLGSCPTPLPLDEQEIFEMMHGIMHEHRSDEGSDNVGDNFAL